MNFIKRHVVALAALVGVLVGGACAASADTLWVEPTQPAWMSHPCNADGLGNANCYFPDGAGNFWVRTFPTQNISCLIHGKGDARQDVCFPVDEGKPLGAPLNTRRWLKNHEASR